MDSSHLGYKGEKVVFLVTNAIHWIFLWPILLKEQITHVAAHLNIAGFQTLLTGCHEHIWGSNKRVYSRLTYKMSQCHCSAFQRRLSVTHLNHCSETAAKWDRNKQLVNWLIIYWHMVCILCMLQCINYCVCYSPIPRLAEGLGMRQVHVVMYMYMNTICRSLL